MSLPLLETTEPIATPAPRAKTKPVSVAEIEYLRGEIQREKIRHGAIVCDLVNARLENIDLTRENARLRTLIEQAGGIA